MGIENGSGIACGVGFVVEKLMPRMATKQSSSMLLGPFLDDLDDTQAGTLQAAIRRTEERENRRTENGERRTEERIHVAECGLTTKGFNFG